LKTFQCIQDHELNNIHMAQVIKQTLYLSIVPLTFVFLPYGKDVSSHVLFLLRLKNSALIVVCQECALGLDKALDMVKGPTIISCVIKALCADSNVY